jgi:LysR family glycine cleavage system transcriptional activator
MRRLPSLNALRAFEAAARHQSFRAAGEELHVTHSAISHQVADLEADMRTALFIRHGRSVKLTRIGQMYFSVVREALDRLDQGTEMVRRSIETRDLIVQAYVTFSMLWLIPHLADFERHNPGIRMRLSTSDFTWDFDADNVDLGIIYARDTSQPRWTYDHLFDATLFPVCCPGYLTTAPVLAAPADLAHHKLLRIYTTTDDWQPWLEAVGLPQTILRNAQEFDSYLTVLAAARSGLGIAMANSHYVAKDLEAGTLVKAVDRVVPQPGRWYLVYESHRGDDPNVVAFRNWLRQVIGKDAIFAAAAT